MLADLEKAVPLSALLGYLNFSEGKPDPRFQKQFNEAYAWLAEHGSARPWEDLRNALEEALKQLRASGSAAFRDTTQAAAVLTLVFDHLLPAYRQHHLDLLFHLSKNPADGVTEMPGPAEPSLSFAPPLLRTGLKGFRRLTGINHSF